MRQNALFRERFPATRFAHMRFEVCRVVIRLSMSVLAVAMLVSRASGQATLAVQPANGGAAWTSVQKILGGKGTMQPGNVLKFGFPRSDLQVTVDGVLLKPSFALGSWVAFKRLGASGSGDAMVMGDLVLVEDEVGPVMAALQEGGVEQTALHNHVLRESPRVMYMHIMAHGNQAKIATAIRSALGSSKTPVPQETTSPPAAPATPSTLDLDTVGIVGAIGYGGRVNGGVYQITVPRGEVIRDQGMIVPPSMGVATAINFQPTGGGKAAITGDYVMTAGEVNNVIRALRANGIQVAALHSHMLAENPRLFFMHFWANDDAVKLARGLRAGLDATHSQKSGGSR